MPALDPYAGFASNPFPVFDNFCDVVPSDTKELPTIATQLYVESAPVDQNGLQTVGRIKVTTAGGQTFTLKMLGGLFPLPVRIRKVWATGTDCAGIVAFW